MWAGRVSAAPKVGWRAWGYKVKPNEKVQKYLENCKAVDRCGSRIIFIKLNSGKKTIKSCVISEAYAGAFFFARFKGIKQKIPSLIYGLDQMTWYGYKSSELEVRTPGP